MSHYLGDVAFGATVTRRFFTTDQTGLPITLAGTPTARVRKGSGAGTTITAGVSLTVDVVTGQHCVDVDLTASASYTRGAEYAIELSAGTVDGVSQVGIILGTFSIENRFPSRKTGAVAADAGNLSTTFKTTLAETTDDYWKDALLKFTSGTLIDQVKKVSAYNGTTKFITVAGGFTAAPTAADTFRLVNE